MIGIKDETFGGSFPFAPHYHSINGFDMHYVNEGSGEPVVMLHGDPTWGYLYRQFVLFLLLMHGFRDRVRRQPEVILNWFAELATSMS
jgi:pimeloyl-ACP methyl ester carboxylesterase